jgi:CheY-like chemotaxis protein
MSARILVVEDEAITALDLKQQLLSMGHDVVGVVDNAAGAVKAAAELKPCLVLMDVRLAGDIDGITAASAIRGYDNIPVVFLTAHADATTLERALKAGPFGYILKPFQHHELKACIEVALYKHSKESEISHLVMNLEAALAKVNFLAALIAVCPECKKKAEFRFSEQNVVSVTAKG